jgi:hypothetical protein
MLKDSKPEAGVFDKRAIDFPILTGRTANVLALFAAGFLVLYEPFITSISACERPEWLENGLLSVGFSLVVLTILAGCFSVLLGIISRKARAAVLGLASIAVVAVSFFVVAMASLGRENFKTEGPAVAQLRTINSAEVTYFSNHDEKWGTIEDLVREELLDSRFVGEEVVGGYKFKVSLSQSGYIATATRDYPGNCSARWDFFSESDAVIRYSTDVTHAPRGMAGKPIE